MSKINKILDVINNKCPSCSWISVQILDLSNISIDPEEKSFDYGPFAGDENFLSFIRDEDENENWHIDDEGNSHKYDILANDDTWNVDTYFIPELAVEMQLACLQSYLQKINSNLEIPFFLYGKERNDFVIVRGKITKETIVWID